MTPHDLVHIIERIVSRQGLLRNLDRNVCSWDVTPATTALLDAGSRRFPAWRLRRLTVLGRDRQGAQSSRVAFLFYLRCEGQCCHLHGLTSPKQLVERIRRHPAFSSCRLPLEVKDVELPRLSPGQRDEMDEQADRWWQEELSLIEGEQLARATRNANAVPLAVSRL